MNLSPRESASGLFAKGRLGRFFDPRRKAPAILVTGILIVAIVVLARVSNQGSGQSVSPDSESSLVTPPEGVALQSPDAPSGRSRLEAVRSRPEPSTELLISVAVVDDSGNLIPNVELFTRTGSENWIEASVTAGVNPFLCTLQASADTIGISARAPAYVPKKVGLVPPYPDNVALSMQSAAAICGKVVTTTGQAVDKPVRIAALPWLGESRVLDLALGLSEGDPTVVSTSTNSDGDFCLDGLKPGRPYGLSCGGAGYIQTKTLRRVVAPAIGLTIEVACVYGGVLQFVDPSGGPVQAAWSDRQPTTWWIEQPEILRITPGLGAILAGIDPVLLDPPDGAIPLLYGAAEDSHSLGPLRVIFGIPGYAAGEESLLLNRLGEKTTWYTIVLERIAPGFGAIEVILRNRDPTTPQLLGDGIFGGTLLLEDEQGKKSWFTIPAFRGGRALVEGVPWGHFSVNYRAHSGGHQYPGPSGPDTWLEVGQQPARFQVDATECGAIQLHLWKSDLSEYRGSVQVVLSKGQPLVDHTGGLELPGAQGRGLSRPFMFLGIPAGTYSIFVLDPPFKSVDGKSFQTVEVRASGVSETEWYLFD